MDGTLVCSANYVPLSPISFLKRSAIVYRDRISIVYGNHIKFTWKETFERCTKLASALTTHTGISRGDIGTLICSANYVPLSPITFLQRSAIVYRDKISIVYGNHIKFTWKDTCERCTKLASSLNTHSGIPPGDIVAVLAPNIPEMYELHFGVPMAGAVLCTLNTRHDSAMISVLLNHSEAKIIFVDYQFLDLAKGALKILSHTTKNLPQLVLIPESDIPPSFAKNKVSSPETLEYKDLLAKGCLNYEVKWPNDEMDPITVNYTSGTTSSPKGVIYSHRGSYLNSISTLLLSEMTTLPVYLWTVPMFHCNGWCLAWGVAAQGGMNICMRSVSSKAVFKNISLHNVTHFSAAPTVLSMLVKSSDVDQSRLQKKVTVMTGGAPPPQQIISKMEEFGFKVIHLYGLTETYGPGTFCIWQPEWDFLPPKEQAKIKGRQGLQHLGLEEVDIKDPITLKSVPKDGKTIGEVMFRGNTVMSGYLKDLKATEDAFKGGWFRSGDLGVKHSDGYIEIKDRSKDIIISGGENISTIEVESVLLRHPGVLEAAVVARPDDYWGETPCAFVKLKDLFSCNADDIIKYCRDNLPHFMAPRTVVFEDLPKTSTGKTQKFILRQKAKDMGSLALRNISNKIV